MGFLFGSNPSAPNAPAPPPPPPAPTQYPDQNINQSGDAARKKAIAAGASGQTMATGPQGLTTQANTTSKTLLGQ